MKKILKPSSKEDCIYYSDMSGKLLNEFPPVTITIEYNYGSKKDGDKVEMHMTDEEMAEVFGFIKRKAP